MNAEALLDQQAFIRGLAASLTFANEDPDDVVQETWLAAVRNPPKDGPGVRGWLATVVRNALRQSRRSGGRRIAREALTAAPKTVPTPDEIREREAVRREVVEAVLELDEPYRTAVLLRYYEELPPRKIAERTGDPVETVKTRLVRARGMLRERLDERHDGNGRSWGFAVAGLSLWPGEAKTSPIGTALPLAKIATIAVAVALTAAIGVTVFATSSAEDRPGRVATGPDPESAPAPAPEPAPVAPVPQEAPPEKVEEEKVEEAKETARIEGRVLDQKTSEPVAGANVRMVVFGSAGRKVDVVSDEKGRYRFDDVPAGERVRVFIRGRGKIVQAGRPEAPRTFAKGETARWDLRATRRPGLDLTVRLRLPEGAAVPEKLRMTSRRQSGTFSSIDIDDLVVDASTRSLTLFLGIGRHHLAFESAGLKGALDPVVVEGETPAREVVLELRARVGVRLRLVDGKGRPLRQGGARVLVLARMEHRDPRGNTNFSVDSLGYHEIDESGELDLTPILPTLDPGVSFVSGIAFALEFEGAFRGSFDLPNFEIPVKEIRRRQEGGGVVVLDLPVLPERQMETTVRDAQGKPVAGVRVVPEPKDYFADTELVSDARGRLVFRLRKAPPFPPPMPPEKGVQLHLVAQAPWVGRVDVIDLGRPSGPRGEPRNFVVSRAVEVSLELVNDAGEPIAGVDAEIDLAKFRTDTAGVLSLPVAEGTKILTVKVAGHLPERVELTDPDGKTVVRLERAREIVVRFKWPDGSTRLPVVLAREAGRERIYVPTHQHPVEHKVTLLVPRRTVIVYVHPAYPGVTGEIEVGPDVSEVELVLRKK